MPYALCERHARVNSSKVSASKLVSERDSMSEGRLAVSERVLVLVAATFLLQQGTSVTEALNPLVELNSASMVYGSVNGH